MLSSKIWDSAEAAVADVPDGATLYAPPSRSLSLGSTSLTTHPHGLTNHGVMVVSSVASVCAASPRT
mgnify:CR=1 FL=1